MIKGLKPLASNLTISQSQDRPHSAAEDALFRSPLIEVPPTRFVRQLKGMAFKFAALDHCAHADTPPASRPKFETGITIFLAAGSIFNNFYGIDAVMREPLLALRVVGEIGAVAGIGSSLVLLESARRGRKPRSPYVEDPSSSFKTIFKTWRKALKSPLASPLYFLDAVSFPMAVLSRLAQVDAWVAGRHMQEALFAEGVALDFFNFRGMWRQARESKAKEEGREIKRKALTETAARRAIAKLDLFAISAMADRNISEKRAREHLRNFKTQAFVVTGYLVGRGMAFEKLRDVEAHYSHPSAMYGTMAVGEALALAGILYWKIKRDREFGLDPIWVRWPALIKGEATYQAKLRRDLAKARRQATGRLSSPGSKPITVFSADALGPRRQPDMSPSSALSYRRPCSDQGSEAGVKILDSEPFPTRDRRSPFGGPAPALFLPSKPFERPTILRNDGNEL